MYSWATRRKLLYSSFVLILAALLCGAAFWYLYPAPTCSDGKQNQDELGIDCGGVCTKVCAASTEPLRVLWTRPFSVGPGVASAAAYVLNPNPTLGAEKVSYRLRLYDDQNILIAERRGSARIPANSEFPIFEGGIPVGNRTPTRAFLEFLETPDWRAPAETVALSLRNQRFDENARTLEADIANTDVATARSVEVFALLFDESDNAVGASKTFIDRIPGGGSEHIVFTWLTPFPVSPVSERIYILRPPAR